MHCTWPMGPSGTHEKKLSRKNPNMGLQAILRDSSGSFLKYIKTEISTTICTIWVSQSVRVNSPGKSKAKKLNRHAAMSQTRFLWFQIKVKAKKRKTNICINQMENVGKSVCSTFFQSLLRKRNEMQLQLLLGKFSRRLLKKLFRLT